MDDVDPPVVRTFVLHGYENQGHHGSTIQNLRWYLHTGRPFYLQGTRYLQIREGLLKQYSSS